MAKTKTTSLDIDFANYQSLDYADKVTRFLPDDKVREYEGVKKNITSIKRKITNAKNKEDLALVSDLESQFKVLTSMKEVLEEAGALKIITTKKKEEKKEKDKQKAEEKAPLEPLSIL